MMGDDKPDLKEQERPLDMLRSIDEDEETEIKVQGKERGSFLKKGEG